MLPRHARPTGDLAWGPLQRRGAAAGDSWCPMVVALRVEDLELGSPGSGWLSPEMPLASSLAYPWLGGG